MGLLGMFGLALVAEMLFFCAVDAWGSSQKIKLEDVKTLTLYYGKMTTGRRSKPVPQIQCVGGTAGCNSFVPQVVQCYNRGSDGFDVQWKCKTDMDNAFRLGRIDVVCEGYDYPDDPYILKGSCGLEYTIDLTQEGIKQKGGHYTHGDYGSGNYNKNVPHKTVFGDIIMIAIILLLIYGIYKTCINQQQSSRTNDDFDHPDSRYGTGFAYPNAAPPPPGFRTDYNNDAGCTSANQRGSGTAGNFWTGALTGGMLGYIFGNRSRGYSPYTSQRPSYENYSSGSNSGFQASSGTRSASGFGSTRRR